MAIRPSGLKYPCYNMYKDNAGEWRWTYYGDNGEEISVSSESYTTKQNCRNSVTIMQNSANSTVYAPAGT